MWLVPISHQWQIPTFFRPRKKVRRWNHGGIGGGGTQNTPHRIIVFRLLHWAHLGGAVSMWRLARRKNGTEGGNRRKKEKKTERPPRST